MIQSVIVYSLVALFLFLFGQNVAKREDYSLETSGNSLPFYSLEIMLSIALFAILAGLRYRVGVDHLTYLETYQIIQYGGVPRRETFEPGFLLITKLFGYCNVHFFFYFAFWAALQIGFIYYALREKKYLLPFIGIIIILGPYFCSWMNGIRQCIVECAFVFMVELIEKKKLKWYIIAILLASTIHKSAIVLLPFYFILQKDWKFLNRNKNLLILTVCVIIGATPTWLHLLNSFQNLLFFIGYTGYADRIQIMTSEGLRDMAWGPSRISIFLIGVSIVWFYNEMRNFFEEDRKLDLYFILFFIGECAYNLFVNTSHIFLRPIEYFTIFKLPLTAYLFYYLWKSGKNVCFYLLTILAFSYIYINVYKATLAPLEFTLYKFFWDYPQKLF